jgi:hypothetical protein
MPTAVEVSAYLALGAVGLLSANLLLGLLMAAGYNPVRHEPEAERRALATVNKVHHGGEKPGGGGYGRSENHEPMRKGGRNSSKKR